MHGDARILAEGKHARPCNSRSSGPPPPLGACREAPAQAGQTLARRCKRDPSWGALSPGETQTHPPKTQVEPAISGSPKYLKYMGFLCTGRSRLGRTRTRPGVKGRQNRSWGLVGPIDNSETA